MPINLTQSIREKAKLYMDSAKFHCQLSTSSQVLTRIQWNLLEVNWITINVDGVVNNHKIVNYGGMLHDHTDHWYRGFSKFIGNCSVEIAKI